MTDKADYLKYDGRNPEPPYETERARSEPHIHKWKTVWLDPGNSGEVCECGAIRSETERAAARTVAQLDRAPGKSAEAEDTGGHGFESHQSASAAPNDEKDELPPPSEAEKAMAVDELVRLDREATPGPWAWDQRGEKVNEWGLGIAFDANEKQLAGRFTDEDAIYDEYVCSHEAATCNYKDPALICTLRNNLPEIISALRAASHEPLSWQPIETAPKTGPVETILLYVPTLHGTGGPVLAHWAHGGGEEQPAFGPAWFFWTGYDFSELTERPTHWMALPRCPADWRGRAASARSDTKERP